MGTHRALLVHNKAALQESRSEPMQSLIGYLNLAGLIADLIGFLMLGLELIKHPDRHLFWGAPYWQNLTALSFVIAGFALQILAQVLSI
jgi:hypothetical protein